MRFLLVLPLLLQPLTAQTLYELVDLGAPSGTNSWAQDISDSGRVVYFVESIFPLGSQYSGWLWEDGNTTNLGSLGGTLVFPLCVNNSSMVGGYADLSGNKIHGFSWDAGVMSDLGAVYKDFSRAQSVNDRGWFAGITTVPVVINLRYAYYPVIWAGGNMITLTTFGGWISEAKSINNFGTVVGSSQDVNAITLPFRAYPDGTFEKLPALAGGSGMAQCVSDLGEMAGHCQNALGENRAVFWDNSGVQDLGTLAGPNSFAFGLNHESEVVGNSGIVVGGGGGTHAFHWQGGVLTDLNTVLQPGHNFQKLSTARRINDAGMIVGAGLTNSGDTHGYVLIPQRLRLLGPETGIAGGTEKVVVEGATPGNRIKFAWGTQFGQGPAIPGCSLNWSIGNARPAGSVVADSFGRAELSVPVPASFADVFVLVQAWDSGSCSLSNRLGFRFRP